MTPCSVNQQRRRPLCIEVSCGRAAVRVMTTNAGTLLVTPINTAGRKLVILGGVQTGTGTMARMQTHASSGHSAGTSTAFFLTIINWGTFWYPVTNDDYTVEHHWMASMELTQCYTWTQDIRNQIKPSQTITMSWGFLSVCVLHKHCIQSVIRIIVETFC